MLKMQEAPFGNLSRCQTSPRPFFQETQDILTGRSARSQGAKSQVSTPKTSYTKPEAHKPPLLTPYCPSDGDLTSDLTSQTKHNGNPPKPCLTIFLSANMAWFPPNVIPTSSLTTRRPILSPIMTTSLPFSFSATHHSPSPN